MARFTATLDVAAPAGQVWAALVDWPAHGEWVPLTTVTVLSDRPDGVGARFVGRTGVGPLGFDDTMEVTVWHPPAGDRPGDVPGRCAVVKTGRVIRGGAAFTVTPIATGASVRWDEDVTLPLRPLTRLADPLLAVLGRVAFASALRKMAAGVEAR